MEFVVVGALLCNDHDLLITAWPNQSKVLISWNPIQSNSNQLYIRSSQNTKLPDIHASQNTKITGYPIQSKHLNTEYLSQSKH